MNAKHAYVQFMLGILACLSALMFQAGPVWAQPESLPQTPLQQLKTQMLKVYGGDMKLDTVFNPFGTGKALWVRARTSAEKRMHYRPRKLMMGRLPGRDDIRLSKRGNRTLRELLVNFDAEDNQYVIYYQNYHHGWRTGTERSLTVNYSARDFLAENFQAMLVDAPLLAVGIKYLQKRNQAQGIQSWMAIRKAYRSLQDNRLVIDADGGIHLGAGFEPLDSLDLQTVYFLEEQRLGDEEKSIYRYYVRPEGLQRMQLQDIAGFAEQPAGFWPKQGMMQHVQDDTLQVVQN